MDEDYQKKRREAINKRPADLKEGLARGGQGLVMVRYLRVVFRQFFVISVFMLLVSQVLFIIIIMIIMHLKFACYTINFAFHKSVETLHYIAVFLNGLGKKNF